MGAALYFVGAWCLDGTHGLIDGAVMPALAAAQPTAVALLAPGHASQDMLAAGPMRAIVGLGIALFVAGSLLLGAGLARAGRLPRVVSWGVAVAWVGMPASMFVPQVRLAALALPYLALVAAGAALALRGTPVTRPTRTAPGAVDAARAAPVRATT